MTNWNDCNKILCIRPDNMGDLLMSGPAIRALKSSFNAHITVLTSSMAAGIAAFLPEIDEVIVFDIPWVKSNKPADSKAIEQMIAILREKGFDAAVIFTVFSQSSLPSAMLAYQAEIPKVLAYCRENPYGLITNWVPDEEPYALIRHQVKRDIHLVSTIGAKLNDERLHVNAPMNIWLTVQTKLEALKWHNNNPWLILHPGVSEVKRQYPIKHWVAIGIELIKKGYQIILTGTANENTLVTEICQAIGSQSFNAAGLFKLDELICLIKHSQLLLSVNTGPVHIAAAVGTPVLVLYAQTNPQHTPWKVSNRVFEFPVHPELQSNNQVIRYLQQTIYKNPAQMPTTDAVVQAVDEMLMRSAPLNQLSP
jgi:lipopolysaccharide heptosyltransferase II